MNLLSIETDAEYRRIIHNFELHKENLITRNQKINLTKTYETIPSLSVKNEYLWTSGMISNCKDKFSWCSINKKVRFHSSFYQNGDGTKCLAVDLDTVAMTHLNCNKEMYFACEVFFFLNLVERILM